MFVAKIVAPVEADHCAKVVEFLAGIGWVLIRKDVYRVASIFY